MKLTLRNIREDDKRMLFDWANDPETRRQSISTSPITWSTHEKWFADRLRSESSRTFVALDAHGHSVGQIRFEKRENFADIGMSIDIKYRGMGFGTAILEEGCKAIFEEWQDIAFVLGEVKRDNEPSRMACLRNGFTEQDPGGEYVVYKKSRY
ncbi:MAG TPA: GNAT family N-acetyltransferase [Bacteroidota bacterium]|nr:GNAT family N-acetyltransferase [Bacteroidota bacterium]